jgi:hypothetical protein
MTESVMPAFEVVIDPSILGDDRLRELVNAATRYFMEQYEPVAPGDPPTPPQIQWDFQPLSAPPFRFTVREVNALGYREVLKGFTIEDLRGERERNVHMLTVWRRLLDLRSAKRLSILEQLVREAEEQTGGDRGVSN